MLSASEFMSHLARRGVLRDPPAHEGARRRDAPGDVDWIAATQLTPMAFADELAAFYGWPRVQRADLVNGRFAGAGLSRRFLQEERLFPYESPAGTLMLALAAPAEPETVRAVEIALRRSVVRVIASPDDIDAALAISLEAERPATAERPAAPERASAEEDLDDLKDLARGAPVVRAVDDLLRLAVEQRATDLHVEPFADSLHVRLRVDGLLKPIAAPPLQMARGILSRIKILAGLNITERRMPQDGRAKIVLNGNEFDLRVATMPTMYGESAVIRLLRKNSGAVALNQIGLSKRDEAKLREALQAPFGMIIVTGPTGSGKTTTLAASLDVLNEATRKILTIEDPIEYQIPGVNQSQVRPAIGLTFASALRSFLRQDPDVIMVGEMRDGETAHIGVQAALTGHLMLTTLHTNTAAAAVTRLIDMGVESFLLASSIRAIVGQRLVRILCEHCKEPYRLSAADMAGDHRFGSLGFAKGDTVYRPKGCQFCNFVGFRGRKGVFEVLEVTEEIQKNIGDKTDANELDRVARDQGMSTMTEDGVAKCRVGLTTIDEIFRVTASR